MPEFVLAEGAENDLDGIASYTVSTWGSDQARHYAARLTQHFHALAEGAIKTKTMFEHWPELRVSRCQHHYVFSISREDSPAAILAVLHENMDLPTRLLERLQGEG